MNFGMVTDKNEETIEDYLHKSLSKLRDLVTNISGMLEETLLSQIATIELFFLKAGRIN
jgi:hypothetical protein